MFGFFDSFMSSIGNTVAQIINGLLVGVLSFIDGLLDKITMLESFIEHAGSSVVNFFEALSGMGEVMLPMLPAEWVSLIFTALLVLAFGSILRKKVIG